MELDDGRPIALIGLMGAGKSALAAFLGPLMEREAVDLDRIIEASAGCTISELFEREGEPRFRLRERAALESMLTGGARIISCGGGIVTDRESRMLLQRMCHVIWLEVSPAEAARRLAGQLGTRPLLAWAPPEVQLVKLLAAREPLYAACAHTRVDTDARNIPEVARAVLAEFGEGE